MIRQGVTLIATAVLGAGLLAGCGSSGESAEAPAEEGKTEVGTGSIGGEPVFDGDVGFQVTSVNRLGENLPPEVQEAIEENTDVEIPDGAAIWKADVTVTNNGKKAVSLCGDAPATAIDQDDREYDMEGLLGTQVDDAFLCKDVDPGFTKSGPTFFAMPEDSEIKSFKVYDRGDDDDILGDTYVVINR